MVLPELTPAQRTAALEKAAAARVTRARVKQELKSGQITLSEVLARAGSDEALAKLKVVALLEALPGVGRATAQAVMEQAAISPARRVRGLGRHQRDALVSRFG